MNTTNILNAYSLAKERYASLGIDTDKAITTLEKTPISLHCTIKDDKLIMDDMKCDVDIDGDNMTLTTKEKDTYNEDGQHATMESKVVIKLKRI